jgi:hypothetical protein
MPQAPWGCFYNGAPPGVTPGGSTNLGFFVERSVNQTISPGVTTVINTDLIIQENPAGTFDLGNNHFKCTIPGRYIFCLSVDMQFSGFDAYGICALRVNGTVRTDEQSNSTFENDIIRMGNSFCWQVEVDDIIDAIVYNGDVFNCTLSGCQNQFSGALIVTP